MEWNKTQWKKANETNQTKTQGNDMFHDRGTFWGNRASSAWFVVFPKDLWAPVNFQEVVLESQDTAGAAS
eukprot:scaffold139238_cov13-Prasinocladus_malaysianus.AAC.1